MNKGAVEQVGSPFDLYESPATSFVRDFIGQTTKIAGAIAGVTSSDTAEIVLGDGSVRLTGGTRNMHGCSSGQRAVACIRPENILLGSGIREGMGNIITAHIDTSLFLGDRFECVLTLADQKIIAYVPRDIRVEEGADVRIQLPPEALNLWPWAEQ
jgi:ABC-type Fe3+/spermidine/putrescine transport system ATPase subunit